MATTEIFGTTGNDQLTGGDSNELILGLAGNDNITAGNGDDTLQGGDGNDYLWGGWGTDSLQGGNGNDYLAGGDPSGDGGSDTLNGGDGYDAASYSFQGTNTPVTFTIAEITGGAGLQADGHGFTDTLIGIEEIHVLGSEAGDIIVGSSARDIIHGRGGNDTLTGGGGNDDFAYDVDIAHGVDRITDFSAGDVLSFWSSTGTVSINTGIQSGADSNGMALGDVRVGTTSSGYTPLYVYIGGTAGLVTIQLAGTITADDLVVNNWERSADIRLTARSPGATQGNDTLTATGTGNVIGLGGNDSITGSSGDDRLFGGREFYDDQQLTADGNDTLLGMAGNDELRGGGGSDYLDGGDGNDNIYGSNGTGGASAALDGADTLLGGAGNDFLHGASGADSILGGAGNDYMIGAQGNDTLDGGAGNDIAAYDFDSYTTSITLQIAASTSGSSQQGDGQGGYDTLSSIEEIHILGGSGDDIFVGNNGRNYFDGRGGDDTLTGGGGNDTFSFQTNLPTGTDVITDLSIGDNVYFFNPNGSVTFNTTIQTGSNSSGMVQGDVRVGAASGGYTTVYAYAGGMSGPITLRLAGSINASDLVIGNWGNAAGFMLTGGTDGASLRDDALSGGNFIVGMAGNDSITGSTGNDSLFGDRQLYDNGNLTGDGSDTIRGLGGSDIIRGGGGGDYIDGGDGDDTLYGANNSTPVSAVLDGADTLLGGNGNDVIRGNNGDDSLSGGAGDDNLRGDAGNDTLDGGDGIDYVSFYHLADAATTGLLFDLSAFVPGVTFTVVDAFGNTDTLISIEEFGFTSTRFGDTLIGSVVTDYISGNDGNDSISGGGGNDELTGNNGNDTVLGGAGDDYLDGGDGNDTLYGGNSSSPVPMAADGKDTLIGGAGNDVLRGSSGDDLLEGGAGDDNLRGDAGNDTLDGGDGFDFVSYYYVGPTATKGLLVDLSGFVPGAPLTFIDAFGDTDTLISIEQIGFSGAGFNDTLTGSASDDYIDGNDGDDSITGAGGNDELTGNNGNDTVLGGAGDDWLEGGDGNDSLDGGDGDDYMAGNAGADWLNGGAGRDYLAGGAGADRLDGGAGFDTALLDFSQAAAGVRVGLVNLTGNPVTIADDTLINIERVRVYGSAHGDTITGADDADFLFGFAGGDVISGGKGDDFLAGGAGNDTLTGGAGNDHFSYNDNWDESINGDRDESIRDDVDTITDFSGGDRIQFAGLVLKQPVLGAGGQDMARGDVRLEVQDSFTMLHIGLGEGVVTSVRLEGNFAPSAFALVGTDTFELAAINLTGTGLLEGGNWNDFLRGGQTGDTLVGGLGNDTMVGGAGVDVVWMDATYADVTLNLIRSYEGTGDYYTLADQRGEGGQGTDLLAEVEFLMLSDRLVPLFNHTAMTVQGGSAIAFNEEAYLAAYSDVADLVRAGIYASGAEHYERYGHAEGRVPNNVFDANYYVTHNPDVLAAMGNDYWATYRIAYQHYVEYGRAEGRQPAADRDADGDLYSETYYLVHNPDVAAAVEQGSLTSGYQHYITYGKAEGRAAFLDAILPPVLFDEAFYRLENRDVANAVNAGEFADGYEHFLLNGLREGRDPNILFDTDYYLAHNPDVAAAIAAGVISDALSHYIRFGGLEGRDPSAWFDSSQYLVTHADVAAAGINPLLHYLEFGQAEGRTIAAVPSDDWPM